MDISRYSRGKIYKIVNTVDDKIYVGSTCSLLTKRLYEHKSMAKSRPSHAHIHLNEIGWENIRIILVESVNAETKDQLLQREQYYIDLLNPSLNKQSAYANCPHGRIKSRCKECCGASICPHNKRKSRCKECGGSQICSHNKQKRQCRECGCDKYFCPECELSFAGKGGLNKHLNSKKHRNNYNRMFEECFN